MKLNCVSRERGRRGSNNLIISRIIYIECSSVHTIQSPWLPTVSINTGREREREGEREGESCTRGIWKTLLLRTSASTPRDSEQPG